MVMLQETHSELATEIAFKGHLRFENAVFAHGETNARGTAILWKNNSNLVLEASRVDREGRLVELKVRVSNLKLLVYSIYAPNQDAERVRVFEILEQWIDESQERDRKILLGGDFNIVLNNNLDRIGGRAGETLPPSARYLKQLLDRKGLVDVWRHLNPLVKRSTWARNSTAVRTRLDRFYMQVEMLPAVKNAKIGAKGPSDHNVILLKVETEGFVARGKGTFKMNTSLLEMPVYQERVKQWIREIDYEILEAGIRDKRIAWDYFKMKIREETKKFSGRLAKEKREYESKLHEELEALDAKIDDTLCQAAIDQYVLIKDRLKQFLEAKATGAAIRAKANWAALGEKNSTYFYGLEKQRMTDTTVWELETDGHMANKFEDVQGEIKRFYTALYQQTVQVNEETERFFLEQPTLPTLTDEQKEILGHPLAIGEIKRAMMQMPKNKTPGNDGIPVEFYCQFWDEIKPRLEAMYDEVKQKGQLTQTQCRSIIKLIPKGDKPKRFMKNWRPLSLLNVDFKIVAKALANRIKPLIKTLIHEDQCGFVPGRYIGENIRTIWDIMEYLDGERVQGLLVALDIEKAFDKVDRNFMFKVLDRFGCHAEWVEWVKVLYTNPKATVLNHGYFTEEFDLESGVRQGCPLSPYLFILTMEVMANAIRNDGQIRGIIVNGYEYKLSLFADDTTLILKDIESVIQAAYIIDQFGSVSGLKVNASKTECMGLGSWKTRVGTCGPFTISTREIRILGIYFSYDQQTVRLKNVGEKIAKMSRTLSKWLARGLTIEGRINVARTLGLSQLIYPMTVLKLTDLEKKQIERCLYRFIWKEGKPKVKMKTLIQNYQLGGLKAPCIQVSNDSIKLNWISRLTKSYPSKWMAVGLRKLNPYGGVQAVLRSQFNWNELKSKLSPFYSEIVKVYAEYWDKIMFKPPNEQTLLARSILNNKSVKMGQPKRMYYNPILEASGVSKVRDLLGDNGLKLSYEEALVRYPGLIIDRKQWKKLWTALPIAWRNQISNNWNELFEAYQKYDPDTHDPTKLSITLYKRYKLGKLSVGPTAKQRWAEKYWVSNELFEKSCRLAHTVTSDVRLRNLQYRIIHRIIPTKQYLFYRRIVDDKDCKQCQLNVTDTTEHMLYYCPVAKRAWRMLEQVIREIENQQISFDLVSALFGQIHNLYVDATVLNLLGIYTKQFIYNLARKEIKDFSVMTFRHFLTACLKTAFYASIILKKKDPFIATWNRYLRFFEIHE